MLRRADFRCSNWKLWRKLYKGGNFLEGDSVCFPCMMGCRKCLDKFSCQECKRGFTFKNEKCVREANIYLDLAVFSVGIFLFAIFLFLLVIYCANAKKRVKERKLLERKKSRIREKERKMVLKALAGVVAKSASSYEDKSSHEQKQPPKNPFLAMIKMANDENKKKILKRAKLGRGGYLVTKGTSSKIIMLVLKTTEILKVKESELLKMKKSKNQIS